MSIYNLGWIWLIIFTFFFITSSECKAQEKSDVNDYYSESISSDFKQLYIVFAGPYTASPSSAFGHVFLLIEPNSDNAENIQLWQSINYSADVENLSGASTLIKGVFGNLKGNFDILPFYKKIRDYSYSESRDLWLFPIKLDELEKKRFSDYINQNLYVETQYRFSDKNCATRVLEVLNYSIGKETDYEFFILPQQIIEDEDISSRLSEPLWIENLSSQLLKIRKLNKLENFEDTNENELDGSALVGALKTYEWLYNNSSTTFDEGKIGEIRRLRRKVANLKSEYDFNKVQKQPLEIHFPGRLGSSYSYNNEIGSSVYIDMRLGLHDFYDYSSTFPKFDYLNFLDLKFRYSKKEFRVEELWVFHQSSRQPKNYFSSPASWSLAVGGKRFDINQKQDFAFGAFLGIGKTYSIYSEYWISSIILNINPVYVYDNSWNVVFNPAIEQRVFLSNRLKALLQVNNPWYLKDKSMVNLQYSVDIIYNINKNVIFSIGGAYNRQRNEVSSGLLFNFPY